MLRVVVHYWHITRLITIIIIEVKTVWKTFFKDLIEGNWLKNKMFSLTDDENELYKKQKLCSICRRQSSSIKEV